MKKQLQTGLLLLDTLGSRTHIGNLSEEGAAQPSKLKKYLK